MLCHPLDLGTKLLVESTDEVLGLLSPHLPGLTTGHGPACPRCRSRALACNITKQADLVHSDKGP